MKATENKQIQIRKDESSETFFRFITNSADRITIKVQRRGPLYRQINSRLTQISDNSTESSQIMHAYRAVVSPYLNVKQVLRRFTRIYDERHLASAL
jgi:hypothetical protein